MKQDMTSVMKKLMWVVCVLLFSGGLAFGQQEITMQQLLREMVDRNALTLWPDSVPYRTLQASSYNRASVAPDRPGWFADSDGVFCIRTETNRNGQTEWVLMEDEGPGVITKIWAVCFYYGLDNRTGGNINIYLDGADEPAIRCNFFDFVQGRAFVRPPLAAASRRAGNCYLPIPYAKGCKVTMDRKVFYHIINYRSYPAGTPVRTFTMDDFRRSAALVDSVSQVLDSGTASPLPAGGQTRRAKVVLAPGSAHTLRLRGRRQAIGQLEFRLSAADTVQALRSTVLKMSFDGEQTVWTPLGDFFNNGVGHQAYRMWERSVRPDGTMVCRWVMPFRRRASVTLENLGRQPVEADFSVISQPYRWQDNSLYFHSRWQTGEPTPGFPLFDYNFVKVEGCGRYVGDQMTVLNPTQGWWGEGDEKVYVDNDTFPSHFGTGTEDYYGWAGGVVPTPADEFSQPFLASVRVAAPRSMGYNTCTRTRSLDAIPFARRLDFNMESSSGTRTSWFHLLYAVNTYFYARPGAVTNRAPLPGWAARPVMSLSELQALCEQSKARRYICPDAVEAEAMQTWQTASGVAPVERMEVWGELSDGAARCFRLPAGGFAEVRLTEVFHAVPLRVCLLTGPRCGPVEIWVNGRRMSEVRLQAEHAGVTVVDLGTCSPVENALTLRFVARSACQLGVDYFLMKDVKS